MNQSRYEKEKFVKVAPGESWYGNYPNNTFEVSFFWDGFAGRGFVSCWGNDDMGLERQFSDPSEAERVYDAIVDGTSQSAIREVLKFETA